MRQLPQTLLSQGARARGFTLIEILIVLGLILFLYTFLLPQVGLQTGIEATTLMARLSSDIRSAFDLAVLSGKPYRMVFEMDSGRYWLEEANREDFRMGDREMDHDPTAEEEEQQRAEVADRIKRYEELVANGDRVIDSETEQEVPPSSPVLKAAEHLKAPEWTRVTNMEWNNSRSLGPALYIYQMQAAHHVRMQKIEELSEGPRGMIYFFPSGLVERAVLHIGYRNGDQLDDSREPYTVVINPFEGTAEVRDGFEEIDIKASGDT